MTECASAPSWAFKCHKAEMLHILGKDTWHFFLLLTLQAALQRSEHLSENISDVKLPKGSKAMTKWVIPTLCVGVRAQGGIFLESTK